MGAEQRASIMQFGINDNLKKIFKDDF